MEDSFGITSRQLGVQTCLQSAFQCLIHCLFLEIVMLFSSCSKDSLYPSSRCRQNSWMGQNSWTLTGQLDPNCLQALGPWRMWRTGGSNDTWKTLLKFYSVNCLVVHVGQRSRSRCIRAIIRGNGGVGIEVATLSDNQVIIRQNPLAYQMVWLSDGYTVLD